MGKKVLGITVFLMVTAMLSPAFIGAVLAGYGGKNKATFEWEVQVWPLGREDKTDWEDYRLHTIEKEDGTMRVIKYVYTYGEPPLVDKPYLYPNMPPSLWEPDWEDYPNGGIRLTVTPEGEDPYTLLGTFEKKQLYIEYAPRSAILENSRWSFTITDYEGEEEPPEGWYGSTMYGSLKSSIVNDEVVWAIKSTKGTGIFEGAFLRGTQTGAVGPVFEVFPPTSPPVYVLFTWTEGSGEIVFP
jgi:hypothetical protein